jgi:hypothetical protein
MQLKASHLLGGQIVAQHVGVDSVLVDMVIYGDSAGFPPSASIALQVKNQTTNVSVFVTVTLDTVVYLGNRLRESHYVTLLKAGNSPILDNDTNAYLISMSHCCRSPFTANLTSGGNIHLETLFTNKGTINSTPVFLNSPITVAQIGKPFQHNPLPFDADFDSVYCRIDTPWDGSAVASFGYSSPSFTNSGPLTIDASTGQITWTPNLIGSYIIAVMADEYRNGIKIGYIRREFQVDVLDSTAFGIGNTAIVNANNTVVPPIAQLSYTANGNTNFNVDFLINDLNSNQQQLALQGEVFFTGNPATNTIVNATPIATANISWTPWNVQARQKPYVSTLRIKEHNPNTPVIQMKDVTFSIIIAPTYPLNLTGNKVAKNSLFVSPNPVVDLASVSLFSNKQVATVLETFDITGKKIFTKQIQIKQGVNVYVLDVSTWQNGIYVIYINGSTNKIIVQH